MAELKTKPGDLSVEDFLDTVKDDEKRKDAITILKMMRQLPAWRRKWGEQA